MKWSYKWSRPCQQLPQTFRSLRRSKSWSLPVWSSSDLQSLGIPPLQKETTLNQPHSPASNPPLCCFNHPIFSWFNPQLSSLNSTKSPILSCSIILSSISTRLFFRTSQPPKPPNPHLPRAPPEPPGNCARSTCRAWTCAAASSVNTWPSSSTVTWAQAPPKGWPSCAKDGALGKRPEFLSPCGWTSSAGRNHHDSPIILNH